MYVSNLFSLVLMNNVMLNCGPAIQSLAGSWLNTIFIPIVACTLIEAHPLLFILQAFKIQYFWSERQLKHSAWDQMVMNIPYLCESRQGFFIIGGRHLFCF